MTDTERAEADKLAVECDRLRQDSAFAAAVKTARSDVLEELATAKPEEIQRLQAEVAAIDRLCGAIASAILKAKAPRNIVGTPAD